MGCAVNTVRAHLAREEAPKYERKIKRKTKLAAFEAYLRQPPSSGKAGVDTGDGVVSGNRRARLSRRDEPVGLSRLCPPLWLQYQVVPAIPGQDQRQGRARFNGYLRGSFYVPLVAKLKPGGLTLDAAMANREVRRWLDDVANVRVHGTTQEPLHDGG